MSRLAFQLKSFKPSAIGGIAYELTLSNAEIAMLRLLLAPDDQAFPYWEKYWQAITDYEDSPFGCKELMPLAVRKMQRATDSSVWQSVAPQQATFLAGLPKYTWTKNRIIFQQFQILCTQLASIGVPVMAIKGMAEMLRDPEVMFMRTSRDIDLVIQPQDLVASIELFQSLGWHSEQVAQGVPFPLSEFDGNSFTFDHPEHFISLDIHFDAVSDSRGAYKEFTQELWDTRKTLPGYQGLLSIPSLQNQFCLFLANAFVPDNWSTGLVNKYLYDLLRQLQDMTPLAKKQAQERAQTYLQMGDYARQIIHLSCRIDPMQTLAPNSYKNAFYDTYKQLAKGIKVTENLYYKYWHLHNYYLNLKPNLVKQYGAFIAYLWMLIHYICHLRCIQVCYWRIVTWKDQLIERANYYFGRIIFYRQKYKTSEFITVFRKKLVDKVNQVFKSVTINSNSNQDLQQSPNLIHCEDLSNDENFEAEDQPARAAFPPGMSQFFYLSFKLLKI